MALIPAVLYVNSSNADEAEKMIRRYRSKAIIATALVSLIILLNTELSPDLYFVNFESVENVSCYYEYGEKLSFADGRWFSPPNDSIFFHETSCRGALDSRQACAVEAAARAHPFHDIHVLFLAPVTQLDTKSLRTLRHFERVKLFRVNLQEYSKNTPLEALVASGALNRTRWRISHTSDVLRYLTLYKWGGVYLDLDTVVVKSFNGLARNWSARESDSVVAAGAMAFSKDDVGRMFANAAIRDLANNFRGDIWGHNGPGVITRVLKAICDTNHISELSSHVCQGFEVYGPELFYPITWKTAHLYFEKGEISETPYIYHIWNKITHDTKVLNDSLYAKLAKRFCPSVYEAYGANFGN